MSAHEQSCEFGERDLELHYLAARLPEQEADAYEAHYFACESCWQQLRRALDLRAAFAEEGAKTADIATPSDKHNWWPIAAGVAIVALLLGTWQMTSHDDARLDPSMRGPDGVWQVAAHADENALTASWPAVADADVYRVRLFAADGTLLSEQETRETRVAIDRALLPQLDSEPLYWSVEALDELRKSVARSDLVEAAGTR